MFSEKPRLDDIKRLDKIIINTFANPYDAVTYKKDQQIEDFVGRVDEIKRILQVVQGVINVGQSKGISLEGPGGCGKSTLFGFTNQLIHQGKVEDYVGFSIDPSKFIIYSTYILAPTSIEGFHSLWAKMFEGLMEPDYGFFEKLCYLVLERLIDVYKPDPVRIKEYFKLLFDSEPQLDDIQRKAYSWKNVRLEVENGRLSKVIDSIIDFISTNTQPIFVYNVNFPIYQQMEQLRLDRNDLLKLRKLLKILSSLDALEEFEEETHKTEEKAFEWFNWVTKLLKWCSGKTPCFLIGIDDIGKVAGGEEQRNLYYGNFFNSIVRMRNSLENIVFVLIGTSDDWNAMNSYVNAKTDLRAQVLGFLVERIPLNKLSIDEGNEVFRRRIRGFWDNQQVKPIINQYYPFSDSFFRYVYNYTSKELRESLNLLGQIWNSFKRQSKVEFLHDFIISLKFIRSVSRDLPESFSQKNLHPFEKEQLIQEFWSSKHFKTDGQRSSFVEKALGLAFETLQADSPRIVDRVEVNKAISLIRDGKKATRRPDVYVEFYGSLGFERKRNIELQVKIYGQDRYVKKEELESSIELLQKGHIDLLILVVTGKGPDPNFIINPVVEQYQNRILGLTPLNQDGLSAIILLGIYQDILQKNLTVENVKVLLEDVLGQPYNKMALDLRSLPKNTQGEYEEDGPKEKSKEGKLAEIIVGLSQNAGMVEEKMTAKTPDKSETNSIEELKKGWIDELDSEFKEYEAEIKYTFDLVMKRKGQYKGKTSETFLLKNIPSGISKDKLKKIFKILPEKTEYFTKVKKSISITKQGEVFYKLMK